MEIGSSGSWRSRTSSRSWSARSATPRGGAAALNRRGKTSAGGHRLIWRPPGQAAGQGVGAVPRAGGTLVGAEEVGAAVDRGALVDDEEDDEEDEELVVDGADELSSSPVSVDPDGDFSASVVTGAEVVGVDGVVGVVSWCEDALVSSPRVVVLDESESPTSADTGFCPISSIPVTMPMATT